MVSSPYFFINSYNVYWLQVIASIFIVSIVFSPIFILFSFLYFQKDYSSIYNYVPDLIAQVNVKDPLIQTLTTFPIQSYNFTPNNVSMVYNFSDNGKPLLLVLADLLSLNASRISPIGYSQIASFSGIFQNYTLIKNVNMTFILPFKLRGANFTKIVLSFPIIEAKPYYVTYPPSDYISVSFNENDHDYSITAQVIASLNELKTFLITVYKNNNVTYYVYGTDYQLNYTIIVGNYSTSGSTEVVATQDFGVTTYTFPITVKVPGGEATLSPSVIITYGKTSGYGPNCVVTFYTASIKATVPYTFTEEIVRYFTHFRIFVNNGTSPYTEITDNLGTTKLFNHRNISYTFNLTFYAIDEQHVNFKILTYDSIPFYEVSIKRSWYGGNVSISSTNNIAYTYDNISGIVIQNGVVYTLTIKRSEHLNSPPSWIYEKMEFLNTSEEFLNSIGSYYTLYKTLMRVISTYFEPYLSYRDFIYYLMIYQFYVQYNWNYYIPNINATPSEILLSFDTYINVINGSDIVTLVYNIYPSYENFTDSLIFNYSYYALIFNPNMSFGYISVPINISYLSPLNGSIYQIPNINITNPTFVFYKLEMVKVGIVIVIPPRTILTLTSISCPSYE